MYYYEVLVSSPRYHKDGLLTYSCSEKLERGTVISVYLQRQRVLGVIYGPAAKPVFSTKPLEPLSPVVRLPPELLELFNWLKAYYPAPLGQIAGLLLPSTILSNSRTGKPSEFSKQGNAIKLPSLTEEQVNAVNVLMEQRSGTALLHGETGSGKTRVYLEIARETLAENRSILLLTPEIGLTSQLVESFNKSFPGQTILLHSNLTPKERRDRWLAVAGSTAPLIVIGPRSALFSPLKSVGLIVMDEAHDSAYKQEQAPYYQTARVAGRLAGLHGARFIMGSATPLVQDYYLAKAKGLPVIRMEKQASQTVKSERNVEIIDLRRQENTGPKSFISKRLHEAIGRALENKQQVLIFLNRRGTARQVLCSTCGWQAACPRCDIPLTYHADSHRFTCHTCGFSQSAISSCPSCKGTDILFRTVGTKAVVSALEKEFPNANILRFDTDNKKAENLENSYASLHTGNTDILVGTQVIGKGLDLPRLGLVGIIAADSSLYFPDFMAEERTYQLLKQVIGRVGRGHMEGTAIVQTYNPDNKTLQYIINNDWEGFYEQQLEERRLFMFPPFCHLLKLVCSRSSPESARSAAEKLLTELKNHGLRVQLLGPSPSFYQKVAGKYRWQIIVKSKDRQEILKIIPLLTSGWNYDLDPVNLL